TLKSVYGQFSEGRYTDMVKELLVLSKDKPEIIQYFKDNQDLFVGVIETSRSVVSFRYGKSAFSRFS
ncbi:MAG: hypothetical protein RL257_497, partial [Actinomycetota bacterium]